MWNEIFIVRLTAEVDKQIKMYMDPECLQDNSPQESNRINKIIIVPFRTFTNSLKIRM